MNSGLSYQCDVSALLDYFTVNTFKTNKVEVHTGILGHALEITIPIRHFVVGAEHCLPPSIDDFK